MSSLFWRENAQGEEYDLHPGSRRRSVPYAHSQNRGSLNLFGGAQVGNVTGTEVENSRPSACSPPISRHWTRDNNRESKKTVEFPPSGIRMVKQTTHEEKPHGLRLVPDAVGNVQHVQVVSITSAYKDPANMPPARPCVQFDAARNKSAEIHRALAYTNTTEQLHGGLASAPVGKPKPPSRFTIDYTAQQRFCRSVSNRAQQRAGGVGAFYVCLMRDLVAPATESTPKQTPKAWSLDEREPTAAPLTLGRCHNQLVALTQIPVSLYALADLLWDMDACSAASADWTDDDLAALPVSYRDFAGAFADNCTSDGTGTLKI